MKARLGLIQMMAALLSAPIGNDPFSRPYNGGGFRRGRNKHESPLADKRRRAKRRISNHNRKVNQAYAR